jgi:hypothetical protein
MWPAPFSVVGGSVAKLQYLELLMKRSKRLVVKTTQDHKDIVMTTVEEDKKGGLMKEVKHTTTDSWSKR